MQSNSNLFGFLNHIQSNFRLFQKSESVEKSQIKQVDEKNYNISYYVNFDETYEQF